jgi:hypothetical protein
MVSLQVMCSSCVDVSILQHKVSSSNFHLSQCCHPLLLPKKVEKLLVLMIWMSFLDVAFEGLVLNQYGTFDHITKKTMDDMGYAYLYCELIR